MRRNPFPSRFHRYVRRTARASGGIGGALLVLTVFLVVSACRNSLRGGSYDPHPDTRPSAAPAAPYSYATPVPTLTPRSPVGQVDTASAAGTQKTPKEKLLARYDAGLGALFASRARARAYGSSQSLCYTIVGQALEVVWPRGFHDSGSCGTTDLNCRNYARSFAEYWSTPVHASKLRLQPAFLRTNKNGESVDVGMPAKDAPVGSVLVWNSCSSNPAGHIAIVTKKGSEAVSDFVHGIDLCPASSLIGVFVPVK